MTSLFVEITKKSDLFRPFSNTNSLEFLCVLLQVAGMFQDPSAGEIKLTFVVTNITVIEPTNVCIYETNHSQTDAYQFKLFHEYIELFCMGAGCVISGSNREQYIILRGVLFNLSWLLRNC